MPHTRFTADRVSSRRQASSRERPGLTSASRLMPTGTSVSGQAFCIDTYRSGSRHWLSGPSIILVPLAAVLLPLFHYLPQLLRWRVRSRVYRWYGELALLERDVAERTGALPTAKWLADLERIERAVARIHTPSGYASESYTLREHIALVRRAVLARTSSPPVAAG